jgi:molybdopterin-guanine dinucleotide biosynthesis protein B
MPIIAVVGSRQSGKTTTVEAIVRGLTEKGYRVATAKHIPEVDFTIDTKDKDTWRHAQAGAKTVMSAAPNELTTIRKIDTSEIDLNTLVQQCEKHVDILIIEGFRKLVAKNPLIPKVVTIKTAKEILETSKFFQPIIAFETSLQLKAENLKTPIVNALQEPQKLVDIVDKQVGPIIKQRRTLKEALDIQVDGKQLQLNPFVHRFMRNVVLAMLSELRDSRIQGDENILISVAAKG